MPTTSADRDKHDLCGAKGRNGTPCRAYAGQGTDHPGIGACKHHGGRTASHMKHAVAIEAKRQMVKMGQPIEDMHPARALLGLLRSTAGHVAWLSQEIQALDELSSSEGETLVKLYDAERDRLVRVGVACVQAGATEHEVRITRQETEAIVNAMQRAVEMTGMPPEYRVALARSVKVTFAQVSDPEAEPADLAEQTAEIRAEADAAYEQRVQAAAAKRPPPELSYPPIEWTPGSAVDADGL